MDAEAVASVTMDWNVGEGGSSSGREVGEGEEREANVGMSE
jgi:hypothetical protein